MTSSFLHALIFFHGAKDTCFQLGNIVLLHIVHIILDSKADSAVSDGDMSSAKNGDEEIHEKETASHSRSISKHSKHSSGRKKKSKYELLDKKWSNKMQELHTCTSFETKMEDFKIYGSDH